MFDYYFKLDNKLCTYFCNYLVHMNEIEVLSHVWLPKEHSCIYISLLKYWDANVSTLSKRTGFHRPTIYKILPYLQELWLISQRLKGKRILYIAENPKNLENIFENTRKNFNWVIDRFSIFFEEKGKKNPQLKTIKWENFAKVVFDDIWISLWKDETYLRYSSVKSLDWQEKYKNYKKIRDSKNIQRMIITSDFLSKNKPKRLDHDIVSIPEEYDLFDDNISKVIYNNKVWIIDYNNKVSFIIEDSKLAVFEKKLFKLMFKFLKKIGK